ncbi:hypothetical protein G5V57_32110 [Nordella sp. HKS 07]|uniref:hypothetical protein n=1 Tax=Nordella sp. HKS 07 TaxID=2712222 RepID=UPI0013E1D761|nr:hypothetical protein [Nordella sp. HKS 07]QIG51942.1 hypothetical protein G5V57_32110 [Nordella sp. HKS 07]
MSFAYQPAVSRFEIFPSPACGRSWREAPDEGVLSATRVIVMESDILRQTPSPTLSGTLSRKRERGKFRIGLAASLIEEDMRA